MESLFQCVRSALLTASTKGKTKPHESPALDALAAIEDALGKIASQQRKTLGTLRKHGIVFDGPLGNDPKNWQHVAFSIYTDLCEVDSWARSVLDD